ncbi:MAG: hypothetical protein KY476_10240 [Planctomycetes bacterium]|nr:hypothetical protein [Planctomycetota bacterium]
MRRSTSRNRTARRVRRSQVRSVNRTRSPRQRGRTQPLPAAAYHRRCRGDEDREAFNAPEVWHEPAGEGSLRFVVQPPGKGYLHPVTVEDVEQRIALLPRRFTREIEVIQFSGMTRKRSLFPCYGLQWGPNVYLYPIEDSYTEFYVRPPTPQQRIEANMYGGRWIPDGGCWRLEWTPETIRDFYLNNVLIHEIGHVLDNRNSSFEARERYANWFAIEYGYRTSRGRR